MTPNSAKAHDLEDILSEIVRELATACPAPHQSGPSSKEDPEADNRSLVGRLA